MKRFDLTALASELNWSAYLPRLVCCVLAALIVAQVVSAVRALIPSARAIEPMKVARASRSARRSDLDLQRLLGEHLFGTEISNPSDATVESQEPLLLVATFVSSDVQRGLAILGESGAKTAVYRIGAELPHGLVLQAVYKDHILMARGGALEALYLPNAKRLPAGTTALVQAAPESVAVDRPIGRDVVRALNLRAVRGGGGNKIFGNGPALAALGLQSGDIVHAINGMSLDSEPVDLVHEFSKGESLSVTIERGGVSTTLNLGAAQLANAAQLTLRE
jgi:general secretion pathway protein C